ncbi:response regulator [Rugosimonospora africana]|uniref:Putative transcriptional regulatory protein KdpE n=1 Tax=Rugosimonospora africana TaxID=556532 RepID=A0A8J3QSC7_9ACTN|nr:response regulator [Rugosimonospora africana]GIH15362.1 putative transcriptional regulatory protein KdpE [Rugosimonospora africana]
MTRVLVVDSEPQILRLLRINLTARRYEVLTARTGRAALRATADHHPDLVVLDLGLPDIDGVQVIHQLRAWTTVPILVVSWRTGSHDKVDALDAGADDYVTKPFSVDELLARVRSVGRRQTGDGHPTSVRIGRFDVDLERRRVDATDGAAGDVHLTPTEWRLLEALVTRPGKLMRQRQLLEQIWGPMCRGETQYLRQYMAQLRRKFEAEPARPRHLLTEPGMGYRFQP